jgi:hypothetical protein
MYYCHNQGRDPAFAIDFAGFSVSTAATLPTNTPRSSPPQLKMVTLTSIFSAVLGLAALTSAVPTLEKRAVTCRDDLGASSFGKVSQSKQAGKQESENH